MRRLRAAVERIAGRDRAARLDRGAAQAVVDELDLDFSASSGENLLHSRLIAARPAEADLVFQERERLVFDRDLLGGVLGQRARFGEHRGHRLADVPHHAARERPARHLDACRADTQPARIGPTPSASMSFPVNPRISGGILMERILACACGERTIAQCSSPGSTRSAMKRPLPSRKRRSSTRRTDAPITGFLRAAARGARRSPGRSPRRAPPRRRAPRGMTRSSAAR